MIPAQPIEGPQVPPFEFELTKTGEPVKDRLFQACFQGNVKDIQRWVRAHPNPIDFSSPEGITPLMLVSAKKNERAFELILNNSSKETFRKVDSTGRNALHYACASNDARRVQKLFNEYQLEILIDFQGYGAAEYSENMDIHKFLHEATQRKLDDNGLILQKLYKESNGNIEEMQELCKKYGLPPVKVSKLEDFTALYGEQVAKVTPEHRAKLKEERRETLHDPAIRKEIVQHFILHPPESVDYAIGYVWNTYGFKATAPSMQAFIDYANTKRAAAANKP